MKLIKFLFILSSVFFTTKADLVSNIPIVGGVLGSITNVSRDLVHSAIDTVQNAGEELLEGRLPIPEFIEDKIRDLLEDFRNLMFDEIVHLGLPRLEPLDINHIDIDIKHEIGNFKGSMDDIQIHHLSEFKINDISVSLQGLNPNITIGLLFDELEMYGLYDLDALVGDLFHVTGNGPFNLTMRGVAVDANAFLKLNIIKKEIYIDDVNVFLSLQNMTCNFENLLGGGDTGNLFNRVIGNVAPEAIQTLWPEIRPTVEEKVKEQANAMLVKIPFDKLLEILFPKANI